MNLYNNILKTLIFMPYIFAFSGMLIIPNGDKKMVVFLIIATLASLCYSKLNNIAIKDNFKNPYLLIIISSTIYGVFSYYYHGSSSREIRALIAISLFLSCFPFKNIDNRFLLLIMLVGVFSSTINSAYYIFYLGGGGRGVGHINPIPYSTICAVISIISYSMFLLNRNIKLKLIYSIIIALNIYPLIVTQSRGVWLALFIGLIVVTSLYFKHAKFKNKKMTIFVSSIALIGLSYNIGDKITPRINQTFEELQQIKIGKLDTSIGLRFQMWFAVPKIMNKGILIGNGDNHKYIIKKLYEKGEISSSLYRFNPPHYHNQFLDKLVKSGIVGIILLIMLMMYPLTIIKSQSIRNQMIIYGLLSIYFIASLTDVPLNHPQTLVVFLLILFPLSTRDSGNNYD